MKKTNAKQEKFLELDLDLIVERLQNTAIKDCDRMASNKVKALVIQWLNALTDSINEEPEWWVQNHFQKKFVVDYEPDPDYDPDEELDCIPF